MRVLRSTGEFYRSCRTRSMPMQRREKLAIICERGERWYEDITVS